MRVSKIKLKVSFTPLLLARFTIYIECCKQKVGGGGAKMSREIGITPGLHRPDACDGFCFKTTGIRINEKAASQGKAETSAEIRAMNKLIQVNKKASLPSSVRLLAMVLYCVLLLRNRSCSGFPPPIRPQRGDPRVLHTYLLIFHSGEDHRLSPDLNSHVRRTLFHGQ